MGLYLYCLLPAHGAAPAALEGVEGAPVTALDEEPFRLWVSEVDEAPRPSLDGIRAHDAVIRAAMEAGATPLPMRFGQWFPDRRRMLERLDEKADAYRQRLAEVEGAVELGIRVVDPSEPPRDSPEEEKADSGREFMEALARRQRERQELDERGRRIAGVLRARLEGLVRRERVETLEPGDGLVSVSHLVARSDVEAYRRAVDEAGQAEAGLVFHQTGPWPPYSFVE
jgi:hypothetical protein